MNKEKKVVGRDKRIDNAVIRINRANEIHDNQLINGLLDSIVAVINENKENKQAS